MGSGGPGKVLDGAVPERIETDLVAGQGSGAVPLVNQ